MGLGPVMWQDNYEVIMYTPLIQEKMSRVWNCGCLFYYIIKTPYTLISGEMALCSDFTVQQVVGDVPFSRRVKALRWQPYGLKFDPRDVQPGVKKSSYLARLIYHSFSSAGGEALPGGGAGKWWRGRSRSAPSP